MPAEATKKFSRWGLYPAEFALLVLMALIALVLSALPASAYTDEIAGKIKYHTQADPVFFKVQRYHWEQNPLRIRLTTVNDPCGGGVLGLRPFRNNGDEPGFWMAPYEVWRAEPATRTYGGPGDIRFGYFRLAGTNNSNCGVPTGPTRFRGNITS